MNSTSGHHTTGHGAHTGHGGGRPGGLSVSESGYTLELDTTVLPAGAQTLSFRITGPDGLPVTAYETGHEKELHLIAVRRDTTGFQHVHPVRDGNGVWSAGLTLTPGDWRILADIRPAGHDGTLTLGADAAVAGPYDPQPLPGDTRTAHPDEYTVTLDGELLPGAAGNLTLTVSRDGRPVTDLQPYLGAYGHLVALRAGDLGYLHVHPEGGPGDGTTEPGPEITFTAVAPTGGTYRLYLDFQHDDTVRTAEFTLRTTPPAAPAHNSHHHGHH
ncbi:hypothetical protein AB0D49_40985 [Streptomyces sp. NPDC048290]|uniref:hypothetical protein n=1 Tax=Streptomyces sp. NPDC048290 TaxID=3155811 RepID=UPI003431927E